MNLMIFIYSLHSGGAERVATNLANYWASHGWKITIVTLAPVESDFYELHPSIRRIGLDAARKSNRPLVAVRSNLGRVFILRKILREIRPDVVLAMMTTANVLLALAGIGLSNIIKIGSEHIYPPMLPISRPWRILRSRSYKILDAVTALTSESESWLREHTSARLIPVIPNPVPWPLKVHEPIVTPTSHLKYRYTLLAVGRLDRQKGFDLLISAFSQLVEECSEWRLVILGEGDQRPELEAQVQAAELGDQIWMPGAVGNVKDWYEAADLYVMSSRFEGFPNTLVEAMAHGLPAISFDCDTGPRDIIRPEIDGVLVPPLDVDGLAAALRRLMANQLERERWGQRASEVRQRFSMQNMTVLWETLFAELRRAI